MSREDFSPFKADDLPDELKKELNLSSDADNKILELFKRAGGTLNISEVLVGLYKVHGEVKTRQFVSSTLYRMRKKKLLYPTGRKGEYTTDKENAKENARED